MSTGTRALPFEALFELGTIGVSAESIAFLHGCKEDGFSIEYPEDLLLPDDEWREAVISRARVLASAWRSYCERMGIDR